MYRAFVLVPDKVTMLRAEDLARALRATLPPPATAAGTGSADDVRVQFPGATFRVHPDDSTHVATESADLASQPKLRGKKPLADDIRACRQRIEVTGEDDPDSAHLNEYLAILQSLEKIMPGVLLLDPREAEVI